MKQTKQAGIYELTNHITGTRYIGSTVDLARRGSQHRSYLRHDNHPNALIREDARTFGADAFEFTVLETVTANRPALYAVEQQHLDQLPDDSGYNRAPFAHGGNGPHSLETRKRISEAKRGKRNTPEHCANIGKAMTGRIFTEEHRKNLTEANRRSAKQQNPNKGANIRATKSQGQYVTPWGVFLSPNKAQAANPDCSSPSIRRYCRSGGVVTKSAATRSPYLLSLGSEAVGRSFADLGFGFIPKQ